MSQETLAQAAVDAAKLDDEDLSPETRYASILEPLFEKYGKSPNKIAYWDVPDFGLVVAVKPSDPLEYSKLVNLLKQDDVDTQSVIASFALKCVVHPDRDTTKRIFKELPAFALSVGNRGQKLCGSGIKELGKG